MLPTFLAGANWVMHSAGWLEGGLVAGYEKFVVDVQILEMLQHEFTPLEIDEESLAFGAHEEVGHGGHFLGAMHTMERFRDLLLPAVPVELGQLRALDARRRAATPPRARRRDLHRRSSRSTSRRRWTTRSAQELEDYVARRRAELGD